jgi:23S rRNA pseudouridine2605 synthase
MRQRLQRLLAQAGLGSRRQMEAWIRAGRVTVNGRVAMLGTQVDPAVDRVTVDGRAVPLPRPAFRYYLLYKPEGYTTSLADPHAERLVTELFPRDGARLFPVGRLDRDTSGALLLTNDGWLAHRLMHPRFRVPKVYEAWVEGHPGPEALKRLRRGVTLAEGPARAQSVTVLERTPGSARVQLVLTEGRKREVRRLLQIIGHPVRRLVRTAYAGITLEGLRPGAVRPLTPDEVAALYRIVEAGRDPGRLPGFAPREERDRQRGSRRTASRADLGRDQPLDAARSRRHPVRHARGDSRRPDR